MILFKKDKKTGKTYRITVPDWNYPAGGLDLSAGGSCGGEGSMLFGKTNQYLAVSGSSNFAPGVGSYTVEWFQYQIEQTTGSQQNSRVFTVNVCPSASLAVSIECISPPNAVLYLWETGIPQAAVTTTGSSTIPAPYLNEWDHYAICRKSGSYVQVFRNGAVLNTITSSTYLTANINNTSSNLFIGGEGDNAANSIFSGSITNFRFTNGYALYSGSFTPPSSPLGVVTGTTLLLLSQDSGSVASDSSTLNQSTIQNSVSWSNASPFHS